MFSKRAWGSLVLAATLLVSAGCGSKPTDSNGSNESTNAGSAEKTYKIGISQIVEHPALDATREGFIAALKDAGLVEGTNLKIDYNNAQGDQTNNLSIAQKIAGDKDDLVLAIATPSAQAVVQQVKDTPVLFAAVTDPVAADIVSSMDQPGGNVSGASDTNPEAIAQLMKFISTDFPNVKKLGLIINEGETNAVVMADIAKKELAKYGIELVKAPVTNTSEVKQAADSLVGRVDALYVTLDNMVVNGFDAVVQTANDKHLPLFSSDRDTVENGSFATVGFKYYDHGYQVGQMAAEILKNGKKPGDMKITVPDKLDLILNEKAAAAQGITITDAMKAQVKDQENNIIK
ncbi:ABC transporter substrate-binding protein [Paenibacillus kobensis]|uniref:ABC transporter substrate-binding protein n=1 Tax=Paenibacillus kobensis TaxID=59841 RepID=UPI000FD8DDF3|nr:ABC transporter substrate-binding protein [Paenibacillus kobensis]